MTSILILAQTNDPVVMKVNGKDIGKLEFEYFYYKYNEGDVVDKITLDEYVGMFKNLKLRVAEAEAQGLDTTATFLREFSEYRAQLAQSYLKELAINENLVRKEYDRMKELVEVSHILVAFPGTKDNVFNTLPADTLEAYKKAVQIRNRALKGENFEKLAKEFSDDTRSKENARAGYLGCFPGLTLNIALEEAAFTTPIGQIGRLVRTNYGYHIVKVHAKKENPGQVNAAHILIMCPQDADVVQTDDVLKKITEVYDKAIKGEDFAKLAKEYSNDSSNASRGGELGWFGFGAMVKEFQDAVFDLKEKGAISKPFRTEFGYHIVKLLDKKPLEPFEEKRQEIEKKLESGGYYVTLHQPGIDNLKKEIGFTKNDAAYKTVFAAAETVYPTTDSFYSSLENNSTVLFKAGNESFSIADFIGYLKANARSPFTISTDYLADCLAIVECSVLQMLEVQMLESKYPEFKNLMQEYYDGILMFEVANREVWEKASEDTEGLENYFKKNKDRFAWEEPYFKGYVVLAKDAKTKKKMQKEISKMDPGDAVEYLYDNYKVGEVSYVKIEKGLYKKGDNAFVDESAFKSGKAERPAEFQDFFLIGKVLNAPESYSDVRGLVVTSYQDYLEAEWQKKLNEKYPVVVYPEVLITIK
ncbi:peptidyl-prolyl cis-trans isomerase [Bacteroidia bacterium]|nr:peptidyl-prolyl cis-trans isomerase [Bacteroidia bacterium]GHT26524.1 peptidyl-prolyl cis-trans isomerase [Bacteroidia bacterium]